MHLLIKYPTRARPKQFIETLGIYASKLARPDLCHILISADLDDRTMRRPDVLAAINGCGVSASIHYGPNKSKIEAVNANMDQAPDPWDIVLLASDDMIPQEHGYDEAIRIAMRENFPHTDGALWWWDGRQDRINTIQCIGRLEYERLGYIYHPDYLSLWCDNEATDVGLRYKKLIYTGRCIIRNESPDWGGKQKRDELYRRNNKLYNVDRKTYESRKALGFP